MNQLNPKFGDRVENLWASDGNPHRTGIFVKKIIVQGKPAWEITDGKGEFWKTFADKESKLKIFSAIKAVE